MPYSTSHSASWRGTAGAVATTMSIGGFWKMFDDFGVSERLAAAVATATAHATATRPSAARPPPAVAARNKAGFECVTCCSLVHAACAMHQIAPVSGCAYVS